MRKLDELLRRYVGAGFGGSVGLVAILAAAGVAFGMLFPKFEATAMLQFPEAQKSEPKSINDKERSFDPKVNVIELAAYKRVASSYDSVTQLRAYLEALGLMKRPGADRLLRQAEARDFWSRVATPVLPFSRRDQRDFGDIKDASATSMLGLELVADARTEAVAVDIVNLLAGYYINAVVRERIRAWILAGKVETQSQEKGVKADILKAELDIELYARRAEDMKAILVRYPDAAQMAARQVVNVNQAEGGERYLSPLAQLVGAESAVSQRREQIRRWQREIKQKDMLARFFSKADDLIEGELDVAKLVVSLRAIAKEVFQNSEAMEEWGREAALRVNGSLDNFEVMQTQFGVRNGSRVSQLASRSPLRLAGLGIMAGLALLGLAAFFRGALKASTDVDERVMNESART